MCKTIKRTTLLKIFLVGWLIMSLLIVNYIFCADANLRVKYQGFLQQGGTPVNSTKTMLFRITTSNGITEYWTSGSTAVVVSSGQFNFPLGVENFSQFQSINWGTIDPYLEVTVDGAALSPRERLTSSAYVIYATSATEAANWVSSGTVMFFDLASCPSGWTEYTVARGRYLVGLNSGGLLGGTSGQALSDQENRAVGQHTHTITDPGHNHSSSYSLSGNINPACCGAGINASSSNTDSATAGITIQNSGSFAGTPAPYIQLLICQKD